MSELENGFSFVKFIYLPSFKANHKQILLKSKQVIIAKCCISLVFLPGINWF